MTRALDRKFMVGDLQIYRRCVRNAPLGWEGRGGGGEDQGIKPPCVCMYFQKWDQPRTQSTHVANPSLCVHVFSKVASI